jgi:hypothetical protein
MAEAQKCEKCEKTIIEGYIDVEVTDDAWKGPRNIVRLHSNGGCLGKHREKHPLNAADDAMTGQKLETHLWTGNHPRDLEIDGKPIVLFRCPVEVPTAAPKSRRRRRS